MRYRTHLAAILVIASGTKAGADGFDWPEKYPAFFDAGIDVRHFAAPLDPQVAFRGTTPSPTIADSSYAGDFRFGVHLPHNVRLGIEGEFGRLTRPGSNVGGAYLLAGLQGMFGGVSLGAELAAGTRTVRYFLEDNDKTTSILEPRVHADVWLAPQYTLGVIAGATLGSQGVTMIGFYFGIHSVAFDRDR